MGLKRMLVKESKELYTEDHKEDNVTTYCHLTAM